MTMQFNSHRPMVMGTKWLITADHPLAAQAGAAVLEAGGNAVDAAVAANLVMAVVRPHMCGFGGDLFALVYMAQKGKLEALNATGRSPYAATLDWYREKGHKSIPTHGILTVTVPGAVDGWQELLDCHGTWKLADLLERPISYAEHGFPMYGDLAEAINQRRNLLKQSPAASQVFLPGGKAPEVGIRLVQKDLARSLELLAQKGPKVFYQGELGEALLKFSGEAGGLFADKDLLDHVHTWDEPIITDYRGYEICTQPPNSQGIALLLQANLLENFDLKKTGPGTAELVHLMVEAKKLAFSDRDKHVCDPAFYPVPVGELLDKGYARTRAGLIDPKRAGQNPLPGDFTKGGTDTIYLAVVDGQGNAVSLIQSLYEPFGSCAMVPGTGIVLHNRGRGFTLQEGHVNRLEPHKRPYHTLHPAMVLKDGSPYMVLGTPGADGQTQTIIQLLINMLEFGADPQQACDAPRWRGNPDGGLLIEGRFPAETIKGLAKRGHKLDVLPDWSPIMGSSQTIMIDRKQGVLLGGACPRRQAYAIAC